MKFSDVFPIFTLRTYPMHYLLDIEMNDRAVYELSTKDAVKYSRMKFKKSLRKLVGLNPEKELTVISYGSRTCPLCEKFLSLNDTCFGCPIYEKTGQHRCGGTPYNNEIVRANTVEEYIPALEHEIAFLKEIESEL